MTMRVGRIVTERLRDVGRAALLIPMGLVAFALFPLHVVSLATFFSAGLGLLLMPLLVRVVRVVADLNRGLAGRRLGVEILSPYRPRPELARFWPANGVRLTKWIVSDPATWRDLLWLPVNLVASLLLGFLTLALFLGGLYGVVLPLVWPVLPAHPDGWYVAVPLNEGSWHWFAIPQGVVLAVLGLWIAPYALRLHALITKALLAPTRQALLTGRVRRLTETRTDAVDTQAAELRRIERDLHDGAQARLVAVGMSLKAIEHLIKTNPEAAQALVAEARDASSTALDELRDLVRGIHPPVLADRGLDDAVRALALDGPLPTETDIELPGRPQPPVESAGYFAVAEILANAAKHSHADRVSIRIQHTGGMLRIEVTDDGVGGADPSQGTGLRGLERRLGTFDGVLAVNSPPGGPTLIVVELPCVLSSPKTSTS